MSQYNPPWDPTKTQEQMIEEAQQNLSAFQEWQRERNEQAARDPRNQQDPPQYAERCQEWALRDLWTLSETANLLCRCDPQRPQNLPGHAALDQGIDRIREAVKRGQLTSTGSKREPLYPVHEIIQWAQAKEVPIPEPLSEALGLETATEKQPRPNRKDQWDRQLCQAIARAVWREDPTRTIEDMINHEVLLIYGNGRLYNDDTLRRWAREVDPRPRDQKGGRPKKPDSE